MYLIDVIEKLRSMPNFKHNAKGINSHRGSDCPAMEFALIDDGVEIFRDENSKAEYIEIPESTHKLADLLEEFIESAVYLENYKGGFREFYQHMEVAIVGTWGEYGDCIVTHIDEKGIHSEHDVIEFS